MNEWLSSQTGRLIFAAVLVVIAFPLLYFGATISSVLLSSLGILIIVFGLALSPVYSILHKEPL